MERRWTRKEEKQERLTGFFWFCIRAGWLATTPTLNLKRISVRRSRPITFHGRVRTDYRGDLPARCGAVNGPMTWRSAARRLRALVGLLRWSGLRIRDALRLEKVELLEQRRSLSIRQRPAYQSTSPAAQCRGGASQRPPGPKPNPRYFFWSGNGEPKSVVADWQRSLRKAV